jgi:peptidoglycan/xylan/chitin deacetylase (PgdA/CDA1 family)
MPLAPEFLVYPQRHLGPDHDRYTASPYRDRAPLTLPGGAKLGLWVTVLVEFFPLNPSGKPFKAPGAMVTPYPDFRHYTTRDYGNRVAIYRILKVLNDLGIRGTFAVQGAVAERYPSLLKDILSDGHEICANGWDTDSIHATGVEAETERRYIADTLNAIEAVTGNRPTGWISPARAESFDTPDYLAEAGIKWFGDWAHDQLPARFETKSGPLLTLPLSNELDDWQIIIDYKRPEYEWVTQVADAAELLRAEADKYGSQILSVVTRPYVMGQPYRIKTLKESLVKALEQADSKAFTAGELAGASAAIL